MASTTPNLASAGKTTAGTDSQEREEKGHEH
ncbi:hypothetical protein LMG28138_01692 [Pararobbsia alpina]|uniref:Uncharacterized protein n=1 Tax=Pararobbsia alpina TaxID=621374 RepID=A0A6S7B067_9BURK|nr:hypothetical protein LMG28138_01692 [Pararobbsia alpina]